MVLKQVKVIKACLIATTVLSSVMIIIMQATSDARQTQRQREAYHPDSYPEKVTRGSYTGFDHQNATPIENNANHQHPPRNDSTLTPICVGLLARRQRFARKARGIRRSDLVDLQPSDFIERTLDCASFRTKQEYMMFSTPQELGYPLAYSLVMYKDVAQTEQLLRAIYRPHNFYCIHVDAKADVMVRTAMKNIANCLHNVFVTPISANVTWGEFGVLQAELLCMKDLLKYKQWKYFINLTGQEFPLKTNLEIVRILKIFKGANNVDASWNYRKWFLLRWAKSGPAPHGIRTYKGNLHVFVNRDFVQYAVHSQVAKDFIAWLKHTEIPDETFFPSLNHNPHLNIPGSYIGLADTTTEHKPYIARFKNWPWWPYAWPCHGKRVRNICVFGVGDLTLLTSRPELFANKFHWDFQPMALECLEWWHKNKVFADNNGRSTFNDSYYRNIPYINSNRIVPLTH